MTDTISTELAALLEEERAALIAGDLSRIGAILERKEALCARLTELGPEAGTLAPLQDRLHQNSALNDAALAGIRRVVERHNTMQEIRKSLDTYDARGKRRSISETVQHRLEKRA